MTVDRRAGTTADSKRQEPGGTGHDTSAPPDEPTELEEKRAIRRAIGLGLLIWPSFFLLDVYMARVVVPGAPLGRFLAYRLAGEAFLLVLWRRAADPSNRATVLRASNRAMAGMAALLISLMAIELGGLISPYMHGLSIVMLVMSVMIPSEWRRSLTWLVPTALMFPAVMAVAAVVRPAIRFQWQDGPTLALSGAHYVFVMAVALVGALCGNAVWLARRQVYEARRLGRYRLKAPIGRGAMNEVWLAWDGTLRRDLAIKILRASDAERPSLDRFLREAQALSRLTSAHTVRVFDFGGSDDGLYFIAMEYLVGADLQRLVARHGPFPPARAAHVGAQICRSIAEAHAAGVVHRDIKPANIVLTRAGREHDFVKVVDFGIAKVLEADTRASHTSVIAGTPHYMAPELWQGHPAHPASDVYAIGATLYFLLTGSEPFAGEAVVHVLARAHIEVAPAAPSERAGAPVPASLEAVVMGCLEKRATSRFASAEQVLRALEACADVPPWTADDAAREWARVPEAGRLWAADGSAWSDSDDTLSLSRAETLRVQALPPR